VADVVVEILTKAHDRKSFDCGASNQNEFLRQRARKHAELGYSQTYVAAENGETHILGFVTLAMGSIGFEEIDEAIASRLPRYPMPVVVLGQLGTDVAFQDRGIGSLLLRFAIERAVPVAQSIGCFAMVIDADNPKAHDWYLKKGFVSLREKSMRVYLPIVTLKASMRHPT
jgi:GNAT superfamily N-acetyltransferase